MEVQWLGRVFSGKVIQSIVGSIASGGLDFYREALGRAVSCLLRMTATTHVFICTNTLESGSCFEAGWNENADVSDQRRSLSPGSFT